MYLMLSVAWTSDHLPNAHARAILVDPSLLESCGLPYLARRRWRR